MAAVDDMEVEMMLGLVYCCS